MTEKNISIWKIEEFLIENLKEYDHNGDRRLIAYCTMKEFLEKLEETIKS